MNDMHRRLAVIFALCGLAVQAAAPKRAIGEAKEDEPVACPAGVASKEDLAFYRGVTWAFDPAPIEVRVQAIEDLGLLGDPRALNALAQLCLDPNPAISRAAVRAIATMRHPRAEEILANVIRHPTVTDATKLRALELLPFQNTWSSLRFLWQVPRIATSAAVAQAARRLTAELPQPWAPAPEPARAPDGSTVLSPGTPFPPLPTSPVSEPGAPK